MNSQKSQSHETSMKTPGRILIFYMSIGSGHQSAAAALKIGINQIDKKITVFCEDLFTPAIRNSIIPEFLSLNATIFLSKVYDDAWHSGSMKQWYEIIKSTPLLKNRVLEVIEYHKPDLLVCTHSLPCSVIADLKMEGVELPGVFAVPTDFLVHPYWPIDGVDGYVVATEDSANRMVERGFDRLKIRHYGIPVDPISEKLVDQKIRISHDESMPSKQRPFNILVLAGGKRLAPYVSIWSKTISLIREAKSIPDGEVHWNVICGKPSVFSQLLADSVSGREDVTIHHYVNNFLTFLNQQDLVISKPGGLILAECTALGIPVILVSRGSGQEAANSQILTASGAGLVADSEFDVIRQILRFINEPKEYLTSVKAARDFGKPNATRLTSEWLLEVCS